MSLLKQLVECFNEIRSSKIVLGKVDKTSVQDFVELLNRSIPSQLNTALYAVYRFNRSKYLTDKSKFVEDIKGFHPYDAMILWADFGDILSFFGLTGKIFLGWDKNKNRYRAFMISNNAPVVASVEPVVADVVAEIVDAAVNTLPIEIVDAVNILPDTLDATPAVIESINNLVNTTPTTTPTTTPIDSLADANSTIQSMEDGNDRLYQYMVQRIAAFQSTNSRD